MNFIQNALKINWSVWDRNATVSWSYNSIESSIPLRLPPISVLYLEVRKLVAIVGNFDEFASANLLLFSTDGLLYKQISAPDLGENTCFGGVMEDGKDVKAILGYRSGGIWQEVACRLNIDDETVVDCHRNY